MHNNIRVALGPRLKYRILSEPSTAMILSSTHLPCKDNGNNFLLDAINDPVHRELSPVPVHSDITL